jgi:hypothetical protein
MKPFGRHNGERSFPSEERSKGSPEWNHYRIVCTNGVLRLHVNGKEVSGGEQCNYRKGYIGLESEGAPVEFRNVRIKELPSGGAPANLSAPQDLGWHSIFNGLDFRGWKTNASTALRWHAGGSHISLKEGQANDHATLWTERGFGDGDFVVDCRLTKDSINSHSAPAIRVRGLAGIEGEVKLVGNQPGEFQRFFVTVRDHLVTIKSGENAPKNIKLDSKSPLRGPFGLSDTGGGIEFMNLYVRDL